MVLASADFIFCRLWHPASLLQALERWRLACAEEVHLSESHLVPDRFYPRRSLRLHGVSRQSQTSIQLYANFYFARWLCNFPNQWQ